MERLTVPDEEIDGGTRRAVIDARAVREEAMKIYWALKKYEDTGLSPEEIVDGKLLTGWIPVAERLPEDTVNPITRDAYVYPVTVDLGGITDIRYYSFCRGHWYNQGHKEMDELVIAWIERPEPYKTKVTNI